MTFFKIPIINFIIISLNVMISCTAIAVIIGSGLMCWSRGTVTSLVHFQLQYLKRHVGRVPGDVDIGSSLNELSRHFFIGLFLLGIVLLLISLLGIMSAYYESNTIYLLYLICLVTVITLHVSLLVFYFARKDKPVKYVEKYLRHLVYYYSSLMSGHGDSWLLGLLMPWLNCCGYQSGNDFKSLPSFTRHDRYDGVMYETLDYPITCCKMSSRYSIAYRGCPNTFNSHNSNIDTGCRYKLVQVVLMVVDLIAYLSLLVLFLHATLLMLVLMKLIPFEKDDVYYSHTVDHVENNLNRFKALDTEKKKELEAEFQQGNFRNLLGEALSQ